MHRCVGGDQRPDVEDLRPRDVCHSAGRRAQGELCEARSDLVDVNRFEVQPVRCGDEREPHESADDLKRELVQPRGAEDGPRHAGVGDGALGCRLGAEVADRHPVRPDHGDQDEMRDAARPRCPGEAAGRHVVPLPAPRKVENGRHPVERLGDTVAGERVPGDVLDPRRALRGCRLRMRTSRPAARSRGTTLRPIVPVPPVTRIGGLMVRLLPRHVGTFRPVAVVTNDLPRM